MANKKISKGDMLATRGGIDGRRRRIVATIRNYIHPTKILFAVILVLVGIVVLHIIASSSKNYIYKLLLHLISKEDKDDQTGDVAENSSIAVNVISRIVYVAIMLTGVGVMLLIYGVRIVSFTVMASSLVLFLGLTIQGTSGDFLSGILLIFENRYDTGDTVEIDGVVGKVVDFSILYTKILEDEGKHFVTIPNRLAYNSVIQNHTRLKYRHIKLTFLVSNNNKNIESVLRAIEDRLDKVDGVMRDIPVTASISSITQMGMDINVRLKVLSDTWPVSNNISYQDGIMGIIHEILQKHNVTLMCGTFPCGESKS